MSIERGESSTADRIIIRPGRVSEIDRISDIINDPPNHSALIIAGSADKAVRGGRVLVRAGVSIHLPGTVVAEIDGDVVGVMDAGVRHPEVELTPMLVIRLLPSVLRTVGPDGLWRLLRSRSAWARVSFPTDPASYYIAELDIHPAYRNRGIGGALLDYGEQQARSSGAPRMTLTTDVTNPAQHLYERHGFRIAEMKRDAEYERWSQSPGRVLMVKELV